MDSIKIGFLGLGTVGTGAYTILTGNENNIAQKVGSRLQVAGILVKDLTKNRGLEVDPGMLTDKPEDVVDNKEIDILVEVMGGIELAKEYVLRGIKNGKSIVTANKDLMAVHG